MSGSETNSQASPSRGRPWARWALAAATAAVLAVYLWGDGGCDDANISFRYASHLAYGYGSVWNPGDAPSMGSSTPLWLVFLVLVEKLWPGHIPVAANLAAAVCWGLLTVVAWGIGEHLGWRRPWMAAAVLAGLAPLAAARMRGMETAAYALLIAIAYLAWLRDSRGWQWGVWAGLCALIRLDGWLVPGVLGAASLITTRRAPFAAIAAAVAMYLPWLGWQWWVTGAVVPQTLHAKALWLGSGRFHPAALPYLTARPIVGVALWICVGLAAIWGLRERRLWPLAVWGVVYCIAYRVAGLPHMGWYYMPLLVAVALLAGAGADRVRFASGTIVVLAVVSGVTMIVAGHPWFPRRVVYPPVMPAAAFEQHGLTRIAHWLGENDPGASVLTNECGILGYLSNCRVIDALGLVSRETWPYIPKGDFAGMVRDMRPDYIAWRVHQRGELLPWAPDYEWREGWRDDVGWYGLLRRKAAPGAAARMPTREASSPTPRRAKRFLVIVSDSLRADHVGCYGCRRGLTPYIDAFARRSVRFENAFAASSWTTPSNAALFTGMYPHEVQEPRGVRVAPEARTMAEYFRAAGFATAGFSAHVLISGDHGFRQGFRSFACKPTGDEEMTARCIKWMRANADDPFLVLLYLHDPHWPYDPEAAGASFVPRTANVSPRVAHGYIPLDPDVRVPRIVTRPTSAREISMDEVEYLHALYDGDIASVDERIGRVLEATEDVEDLAVVVTADHGEEWLDHGGLSHLYTLYDELLRIPLLVSAPGQEPGAASVPVSNLDVLPTLLALAGIRAPDDLRGVNLFPTENLRPRPLFAEVHGWNSRGVSRYNVRIGTQTLIRTVSELSTDPPRRGRFERYDFVNDPGQQHPLPPRAPGGHALWRLMARFDPLAAEVRAGVHRPELDEKTAEELRAIGYLGN
ncbi:MAG: sulfatase [Armatimonadota bacterium]|nr:MAG: sulfatase [Armatimonadota bacterium]